MKVLEQFAFSHALATSVELGILESNLIDYASKVEWIPASIRDGRKLSISRQVSSLDAKVAFFAQLYNFGPTRQARS